MLIFDEKKYAENLMKTKEFETYKKRDIERYILIRYLASQNISIDDIKKELENFPFIGCEYLNQQEVNLIYDKIIERALSSPLVTDITINIYVEEMNVINNIENENIKKLLFILLVYYKWAINQPYLYFFSKYNDTKMVLVNDKDIWKYSDIMKLRVAERYKLSNYLIQNNLYVEDNFKSNNYFYLPFCKDDGEIAITINNYDNLLGELYYYNDKQNYKRCSECGVVIKKTRSPKKYCANCARIKKNEQIKASKRKRHKNPIS